MSATYSLTAIPWLMTDGVNKGHLEYVLFVARNGMETYKWSSTNGSTFVEYLKQLVAPDKAMDIYARLRRGEPVRFPARFDVKQIRDRLSGVGSERLLTGT